MSDILGLIEEGLYTKLNADANLSGMGITGVYEDFAPQDAVDPFVVFRYIAGGDTNSSPRRDVDVEYLVECVGVSRASARLGAGHIDTALHNGTLTVTGWSVYAVQSVRLLRLTDQIQGKQRFRRGAYYRIRMDK